jgi:hypothetical protein
VRAQEGLDIEQHLEFSKLVALGAHLSERDLHVK